jgi:23S rRNA (adenine-N6)-dimethyltransferase
VRGATTPARRWGWHPLEPAWAARLVADAGVARGDLVLDIGAGTGAITAALIAIGARVIAIELHPGRAATLRERFGGRGVVIVQADAADLRLPRRPFSVVANPPWAVSTAIVRRLTARGSRLERADLVLPRWAADRWASKLACASVGRTLPPSAFRHRAPGSAAVLRLATPRGAGR